MTGDGCKGGSKKSLPISTKAPPQANQLPMVKGQDWSSEGEFEEEDKVDENGESSNDVDGEQGKSETEQNGLPDGFYLVEAVRKKRVRQKKPLPSPSPVVTKKKNVCCANAGKTKECSKTMESPTNGQPQDQFGTKLIISGPKEELAMPKTKMASEDKSLQRSQEAQSVGGAKKKKQSIWASAPHCTNPSLVNPPAQDVSDPVFHPSDSSRTVTDSVSSGTLGDQESTVPRWRRSRVRQLRQKKGDDDRRRTTTGLLATMADERRRTVGVGVKDWRRRKGAKQGSNGVGGGVVSSDLA
nr:hypothetical protein Iba_chr04bCG15910 [Ipomoea batatas]